MTKIKKLRLKPSARDKRRYFLTTSANSKIEEAILEYIGVLGFAKSAYMKVSTKEFSGKTVGSCLTKSLNDVRAGLSLAGISILKVSGTLKGLKGK
ncbi:MAG: hypothetical protein IH845_04550 [Nanoarchaeota archaeon]|nr:hypothetical protein [Nanoarchaeota archaeon]